jgi:hypothetical protein
VIDEDQRNKNQRKRPCFPTAVHQKHTKQSKAEWSKTEGENLQNGVDQCTNREGLTRAEDGREKRSVGKERGRRRGEGRQEKGRQRKDEKGEKKKRRKERKREEQISVERRRKEGSNNMSVHCTS